MKIALCGGIASGKSTAADILISLGASVISADKISGGITASPEYIRWLRDNAGEEFVKDGIADKDAIRGRISRDDNFRKRLNEYLHPRIRAEILRQAREIEQQGKIVFVETPLLMTAGMNKDFDSIWYVKTPDDIRIERLIKRSNIDETTARNLLKAQETEKQAETIADVIIDNDNTYNKLCQIVREKYGALIKRLRR